MSFPRWLLPRFRVKSAIFHIGNSYACLECHHGRWFLVVTIQYWTVAKVELSKEEADEIAANFQDVAEKLQLEDVYPCSVRL